MLDNSGPIETSLAVIQKNHLTCEKDSTLCSVAIRWTTSHDENVTRYILKVYPAAAPCAGDGVRSAGECVVKEGEREFESRELSLQLELGIEYEVTVSTVNCGTQAGNDSDPMHILLHSKYNSIMETVASVFLFIPVPDSPSCYAHPQYHDGSLILIETVWDKSVSDHENAYQQKYRNYEHN